MLIYLILLFEKNVRDSSCLVLQTEVHRPAAVVTGELVVSVVPTGTCVVTRLPGGPSSQRGLRGPTLRLCTARRKETAHAGGEHSETQGRSCGFHALLLLVILGKKNRLIIQSFAFTEWLGDLKQANKHAKVMFLIMWGLHIWLSHYYWYFLNHAFLRVSQLVCGRAGTMTQTLAFWSSPQWVELHVHGLGLWRCQQSWKCLWGREFDMSQRSLNVSIPSYPVHSLLRVCLKEINKNADENL